MQFEWDNSKDILNQTKHQVSFNDAKLAFFDNKRIVAYDIKHSTNEEKRYFCFGNINGKVLTVRFTMRSNKIRIIGAGYWREGVKRYVQENKL